MTFQLRGNTYQFHLNKGFFILCLGLFFLCLSLCVWQFYRYHYKKTLLTAYQERLTALPKPLMLLAGKPNEWQFQSITASGDYVNALTMFVQNRFYQGKVGYEVLTPLRVKESDQLLLVDRGWIEKPTKGGMPVIHDTTGHQAVMGYIKLMNEYQFTLGKNILESDKTPIVMQKIDIDEISRLTGRAFYPFILRLDPAEPHGFIRDWVIASVLPERHQMYALQWLAFSLIIVIAYGCFSIQRVEKIS